MCRDQQVWRLRVLCWGGLAAAAASAQEDRQVVAVKKVFSDYKAALLTGDGDRAVTLVDRETLDYYDRIKDLAVIGDAETVKAQSFIDRLLIVSMRHQLDFETLQHMGLEELVRRVVQEGWIRRESIVQLDMGAVEVEGDTATGQALTGGAPPAAGEGAPEPLRYEFVRENGEWKFRFSSLVESLNGVVTQLSRQLGTNEDDLIFQLVEALSGTQVLPDIWERPSQQGGGEGRIDDVGGAGQAGGTTPPGERPAPPGEPPAPPGVRPAPPGVPPAPPPS
jgi:hypothetical protein